MKRTLSGKQLTSICDDPIRLYRIADRITEKRLTGIEAVKYVLCLARGVRYSKKELTFDQKMERLKSLTIAAPK